MTTIHLPQQLVPEVEPFAPICLTQPLVVDLCVYRGDTGRLRVSVTEADGTTPVDVSAATWDADIRTTVDDAATVAKFTVTPVAGQTDAVDMKLSAADSATLDAAAYVYDLEMTLATEVTTLIRGAITVTKDVSRTP